MRSYIDRVEDRDSFVNYNTQQDEHHNQVVVRKRTRRARTVSTNINTVGIHQLNFDLDGTTTAALTSPGVTTISNRSSAITQLTGDVTAGSGYGSVAATVVGVNGASVPASHAYIGTNSSSQIIAATLPLLPANNLSDVSSSATARTNLGLGTMAVQNANAVAITGGAINGTPIGSTTAASVSGTTLTGANTSGTVLRLGTTISGGTPVSNPVSINMGGTYSSTAGANPKLLLYDPGFGIGISSDSIDYINPSNSTGFGHSFYVDGSSVVTIDPTSLTSTGKITGKNLTITSGGGGVLTFQDGTTQSTAASSSGSYSLGGSLSSSNVTLGTGAGTGATLVAVNGLDGTHSVKLTTGSSPAAFGIVWTLTFTTSRGHDTFPVVGPSNVITSTQQAVVPTTASATSYIVTAGSTPLAASTVYQWNVSCP